MMIIIHASENCTVEELPKFIQGIDFNKELLLLAGTPGAFSDAELPDAKGQVGGSIVRVEHLNYQPSAFEVLTGYTRLLQQILAEHSGSIHYIRMGDGMLLEGEQGEEEAPVTWNSTNEGVVTAFHLAPLVASSPLLMSLTSDLAARSMPDERRFAYLAAAFEGI